MRLLVDDELLDLVRTSGVIESLPEPNNWQSAESPIQPSSIDLHVGEIFIPGKRPTAPGGHDNPEYEVSLRTGETAVVTTLETLRFPAEICGIGFPPSHISELGLLMTNPGHIDPGYSGRLRFAVINVGKAIFSLRRSDLIVTVLLFQFDRPPGADWSRRHSNIRPDRPPQSRINKLSHDFVDIESRTRRLILRTAVYTSALAGILGVFLTLGTNFTIERMKRLQDMRDDISILKAEIEILKQNLPRLPQTTTPQPGPNVPKSAR